MKMIVARRLSPTDRHDLVLMFFLFLFALMIVFPYLWMIMTSFKGPGEVFSSGGLLPHTWHPENYVTVFRTGAFPYYILNSTIVTALGVFLEVLCSFLGAYAFARLDFIGKDKAFFLIIATLMVPPQILMLPSYLIVSKLGWLNTYAGLIIPRAGGAFGIFMLRQFILTIPKEFDEAARIDGCGTIRLLRHIYLPLTIPALATLSVFSFIGFWNDYFWPLMVTSRDSMRTLTLGLAHFRSIEGMGQWHLLMAAATIATAPTLIAFIIARKHVVTGLTAGGIKG